MMAPGFRPVGWVAAVATAALGCYMLSLNVASERADLTRIEVQIIATKQEIRALQTELGTRGRMAQLEQWNGEVLALAAPTSGQFLDSEVKLARFDRSAPTIDERATVRMASVDTGAAAEPDQGAPAPVARIEAPIVRASAPRPGLLPTAGLVRRASLDVSQVRQVAAANQTPAADRPRPAINPVAATQPTLKGPAAARDSTARPGAMDRQTSSVGRSAAKPAAVSRPSSPVKLASASMDSVRIKPPVAGDGAKDIPSRQRVKVSTGIDQSLAKLIGTAAKAEAGAGRQ